MLWSNCHFLMKRCFFCRRGLTSIKLYYGERECCLWCYWKLLLSRRRVRTRQLDWEEPWCLCACDWMPCLRSSTGRPDFQSGWWFAQNKELQNCKPQFTDHHDKNLDYVHVKSMSGGTYVSTFACLHGFKQSWELKKILRISQILLDGPWVCHCVCSLVLLHNQQTRQQLVSTFLMLWTPSSTMQPLEDGLVSLFHDLMVPFRW